LAGTDKDAVQIFGRSVRSYVITGMYQDLDEKLFLQNLCGYSGRMSYDSPIGLIDVDMQSDSIGIVADFDPEDFSPYDFFTGTASVHYPDVRVYFENLKFYEEGKRVMDRKFTITVRELRL
jgi:hypothetical protein